MKYVFGLLITALLSVTVAPAQGKFSGYMFGDYFYNVARDTAFRSGNLANSAVNGKKDLQGFQIRRIYLTYDNDISETFTTRFRLEADGSAGSKDVDGNGKITVFVKDAYLKWKNIFKGSDLVFGIQPTSAFEISEAAWGYRSLDKTIMDLRGIVPSREFGASLRGKVVESGMVNYWVTVSNNAVTASSPFGSTSVPQGTDPYSDKYKRYSLNVQVKPTDQLQFTVYGNFLARPSVNDPTSSSAPKATLSNNAMTGALFVGYNEKDKYNFGFEGFIMSTAHDIPNSDTTGSAARNTLGFTVFGEVNVTPELVAIARYDYFDPTTDGRYTGDQRNYVIVGLSYKPDKNVQIIPNVQYETYQAVPNGRTIDPSVTARMTFYYTFL